MHIKTKFVLSVQDIGRCARLEVKSVPERFTEVNLEEILEVRTTLWINTTALDLPALCNQSQEK